MKKILFSTLMLISFGAFAQEATETPEVKNGWTRSGSIALLFNQAAFNKAWTGGGTNNYGGNLSVTYDANYRYNDWTWDNKFLFDYGLTKVDGDDYTKKTNDRIAITSLVGKQATQEWYYSFFLNFQTQFAEGYDYEQTPRFLKSKFMAPGYLSFGPGMLWKKSDNLKVNIAPATSRLIFTSKEFTDVASHFGVEKGKTFRYEFGASVAGYAKFDLVKNVTMENTLNLYSNYLDKPGNIDIDYTANLMMKINDFLSANLVFQAIYDDNAVKEFQIRETFGAGFTYKF